MMDVSIRSSGTPRGVNVYKDIRGRVRMGLQCCGSRNTLVEEATPFLDIESVLGGSGADVRGGGHRSGHMRGCEVRHMGWYTANPKNRDQKVFRLCKQIIRASCR